MKDNFTSFYKAYTYWKKTVQEDENYSKYVESLNNPTSGDTNIVGIVGNKILDMAWVEKVEEVLPFMDKAIRESRSFIEQKDEIVPIEKVKRVNTQSVRHLAQHTNLIAKVEDNGDVLPDKILNIFYESSFSIYENRFLYTLLQKLVDFVEKRYLALKNKDEKIEVDYSINKIVRRKHKMSKMTFRFEYKTNASLKFDVKDDTTSLSGFTRVLRIRSIIHDFYAAPLIKALAGCETVKPPIIHTNLLSKNVNFRTCMELWDYLDRYKGPGYFYDDQKFDGAMPEKIKKDVYDIFVFTNFLTEITFNAELKNNLKKMVALEQKEEKQKEKELKEAKEKKQEKQTNALIKKKLDQKAKIHQKQINELEEEKNKLRERNAKLRASYNEALEKQKQLKKQLQELKALSGAALPVEKNKSKAKAQVEKEQDQTILKNQSDLQSKNEKGEIIVKEVVKKSHHKSKPKNTERKRGRPKKVEVSLPTGKTPRKKPLKKK